jgi:hypothetical protein
MSRLCSIRQRQRVEPVVPTELPVALFDGEGSTIEARQICDVSLTTRVTLRTMLHQVMTKRPAAISKARPGPTMKQYKPLISSAPTNSILNAQRFHYTNSASTDIRKTFANFRRNASQQDQPRVATNVRALTKSQLEGKPAFCSLASPRQSSG